MREGWKQGQLADLVVPDDGTPVGDPWNFPLVTVRLYAKGLLPTGKNPNRTAGGRKHFLRRQGQILVGRQNYHHQCIGVVTPELDGYVTSNAISAFRPLPEVATGFAELVMSTEQIAAQADMAMPGTGQREISLRSLLALPVLIPPIREQRRIVDLLGALDHATARLDAYLTAASKAHASLRHYLMTGGPEWRSTRLGDVAAPCTGRAFPARFQGHQTGAFPYIKCSDMNVEGQDRIIDTAANWIDEPARVHLGARVLPAGTVIFPILGAALATEKRRVLGRPAAFDQNVMGLEPGPDLTPDFLLALMSEIRLSSLAQRGAVPSVNQSIVASIKVSVPNLAEQHRIGALLSEAAEIATRAMASAAKLRSLRGQLLTALLSGEHEIPESYDAMLEVAF